MVGFHLVWVLTLAMVAYAEADGGCRGATTLLGPVDDARVDPAARDRQAGFDAWLDALRRYRQRSGGRAAAGDGDGIALVPCHPNSV